MLARDPLANPKPLTRPVDAYVAYRMGDGPAGDLEVDTAQRLETAPAVRVLDVRDRELVALRRAPT
jgi:hypothetical protein